MKHQTRIPRPGQRIARSAIAVFICWLFCTWFRPDGILFYTQIAALQCMQPYRESTRKMALQRTTGTAVGALYGLAVILLHQRVLIPLHAPAVVYGVLLAVSIMLILYTTVLLHRQNVSYFSTVVFLSIVVIHIGDANPFLFTFNRVLDTMLGIGIGMAVNAVHLPRRRREDILFISGVDDTLVGTGASLTPYSKIELNRMLAQGANFTLSTIRTPASILDDLSDIHWTLPAIVMDGAALFDMNQRIFLKIFPMERAIATRLEQWLEEQNIGCFTNVVIDNLLVITFQQLRTESQKTLYKHLRSNPHRHLLRASLDEQGEILYLMAFDQTERIEQAVRDLDRMDCRSELKILHYPSTDFPGNSYLKIYHQDATRAHMMEELKARTGLTRTVTFGSLEGQYDIVIPKGDGNLAVRMLKRLYRPLYLFEDPLLKQ